MTVVKETLNIFDLGDLKAIRFHCNNCGGEVVQSILTYKMPAACPLCAFTWEKPRMPSGPLGPNELLVHAIRDVVQREGLPMTVRFEIDGEAEEKTGKKP